MRPWTDCQRQLRAGGSGTAACGLELDGLLRRGRCSRAGAFQVVDKHVADRPDRLLEKLVAEALEGVVAFRPSVGKRG